MTVWKFLSFFYGQHLHQSIDLFFFVWKFTANDDDETKKKKSFFLLLSNRIQWIEFVINHNPRKKKISNSKTLKNHLIFLIFFNSNFIHILIDVFAKPNRLFCLPVLLCLEKKTLYKLICYIKDIAIYDWLICLLFCNI